MIFCNNYIVLFEIQSNFLGRRSELRLQKRMRQYKIKFGNHAVT